ncbi:Crp/Fnr family transcriptional regulator [Microvirga sp. M2]|uniref:Crp/Fnr family transcriptional regulator n=1 Tax=Microvirga sp. M2 TaxID=3073270 RepID=UPI0039C46B81
MSDVIESLFLDASRHRFEYRAGDTVFRLGAPVSFIHWVQAGRIHLARHQADGLTLILQRAAVNDVLAEASVYSERYHCDAHAVVETRTCAIPKRDFLKRLAENHELAWAWGRRLAHEVQRARLQVEIVSMRTVAARLDAWVEYHGPVPPRGRWAALAAEIGVSPEALYREMAKRRYGPRQDHS